MIQLWRYLGMPAKHAFALALALSALAGCFGIFLLGLSGWFLTASGLAGLSGAGLVFNHLYPSAGVRGAAFGRVLSRYGEQLIGHNATLRLSARLRPRIFDSGARTSRGMSALPPSDLSALIDDIDHAEAGFLRILSPAAAILSGACVSLGFGFAADWLSGALACVGLLAAAWLIPVEITRRSHARAADASARMITARENIARLAENATELDIIGALPEATKDAAATLSEQQTAMAALEAPFRGPGAFFSGLGGALALFTLWRSAPQGDLALSAGAALAFLATFDACAGVLKVYDAAPQASKAAARLRDRLKAADNQNEPTVKDAQTPESLLPVRADNILVAPAENAAPIGPLTFEITAGSITEIIGPSGAGKTTLAESLMKLHPLRGGALTYGGVHSANIRNAHVLSRIAFSPQFPAFLPGSLREQFLLARPDATDADIQTALRLAHISDAIEKSPHGLESPFNDGEGIFSGGELRRIGLARALLVDPEILVLDEPFSGLESELAGRLENSLADWVGEAGRALIILQHQSGVRTNESLSSQSGLSHQIVELPGLHGRP